MPGGWHQPKPWDHLLDQGWMNCPSRVSGERESDPLYVDMAQGSSALALAVGSVLSKSFCCKEFIPVKKMWNLKQSWHHSSSLRRWKLCRGRLTARTAWVAFHARLDVSRCRETDQGNLKKKSLKYMKWKRKIPFWSANHRVLYIFSGPAQFHSHAVCWVRAQGLCVAFLCLSLTSHPAHPDTCVPPGRL